MTFNSVSKYIPYILILGVLVSFYFAWRFLVLVGDKVTALDKTRVFSSFYVFDKFIVSFLSALVVARLGFLVQNLDFVKKIGFFVLPYLKINGKVSLFQFFPWRFVYFNEGIDFILLLVFWLVFIVLNLRFLYSWILGLSISKESIRQKLVNYWIFGVFFMWLSASLIVVLLYSKTHGIFF